MAQEFLSILTDIGRNKIATASATASSLQLAHFIIGDGDGISPDPTPETTEIVNEVYRADVESVVVDPDNPSAILITAVIPLTEGGWWMRELGILDTDGALFAVAKPVPQYKPTFEQGQLEDIFYEFQVIIGDEANIINQVDPSVLMASKEYVATRLVPLNQLLNTAFVPVISKSLTEPPANPSFGDIYVVASNPTGDWENKAHQIAHWDSVKWVFTDTPNGHGIGLPDGSIETKRGGTYAPIVDVQPLYFYS